MWFDKYSSLKNESNSLSVHFVYISKKRGKTNFINRSSFQFSLEQRKSFNVFQTGSLANLSLLLCCLGLRPSRNFLVEILWSFLQLIQFLQFLGCMGNSISTKSRGFSSQLQRSKLDNNKHCKHKSNTCTSLYLCMIYIYIYLIVIMFMLYSIDPISNFLLCLYKYVCVDLFNFTKFILYCMIHCTNTRKKNWKVLFSWKVLYVRKIKTHVKTKIKKPSFHATNA